MIERSRRRRPAAVLAAVGVIAAIAGGVVWFASGSRLTSGSGDEPAAETDSGGAPAYAADGGLSAGTAAADEPPLRYDVEYPLIGYSTSPRTDRVAALERRLAAGDTVLHQHPERGYLDALLEELDIDPASQVLVFSTTSLQTETIRPRTPRAIYFNDDVYVAWVQGAGPIEIASMDPRLGPVFYVLERNAEPAMLETQTGRCLRCHDSFSMTGGGTPRFIVGSGYIGTLGNIVSHEGWILTTQRTPLRNRWGGWYVTGRHGDQVHLGNIVVRDVADLQHLEELRIGNLDALDGLVDTAPYIAAGSDIVALLVMQHQVDVQNQIARVGYLTRSEASQAVLDARIAEIVEPLVEAMLFVGAARPSDTITGSTAFAQRFEQRGPADGAGRSLRDLDLERRLLRYPLSYLIYSESFIALPAAAKAQAYRRFAEVLSGEDTDERFSHLSDEDREAVREILIATHSELGAMLAADAR